MQTAEYDFDSSTTLKDKRVRNAHAYTRTHSIREIHFIQLKHQCKRHIDAICEMRTLTIIRMMSCPEVKLNLNVQRRKITWISSAKMDRVKEKERDMQTHMHETKGKHDISEDINTKPHATSVGLLFT